MPSYYYISLRQRNGELREASHIGFVHEKRHMDVGGWGGGLAPVTFLGEKSWKISIVCKKFLIFKIIYTKYTKSSILLVYLYFKYIAMYAH